MQAKMRHSSPFSFFSPYKHEKMSDRGSCKKRQKNNHESYRSMSPVFSNPDKTDVNSFRSLCNFCNEPLKPGQPKRYGRGRTFVNADKIVNRRHLAELALKLFNDNKLTSFKLVKVCKINFRGAGYYGLTFMSQEDGMKECLVFQGVVKELGGIKEALFCEIKDDDYEIKLRTCDDDYIISEGACKSEGCPPC